MSEWNSSGGGNVVEWLQRKTGVAPAASRGAIDYFTTVGHSTGLPKPRSKQVKVDDKSTSPATPEVVVRLGPPSLESAPPAPDVPALRAPPPPPPMPTLAPQAVVTGDPREEEQRRRIFAMENGRVELLRRYSQQSKARLDVDVQERLDIPTILQLVESHDVTFICTDTGSGKSTSIPRALLEQSATARIVSTQPRRTATMSVAAHVASLRSEKVGGTVGYWIRGEKCGNDSTRLWYMTSYTLLLFLLHNPLHPPFTHVILDEFHERQPDLEVTGALLKMCLKRRTATFKLIIMSATINTEEWDDFFSGLEVAVYKQSEPEHPIHDYFMGQVGDLICMDCSMPPHLNPLHVDHQLLERHTFVAQSLIAFINSFANPVHSILVFLPGRAQVEFVQQWLEMNMSQRIDVIPWHSSIDLSQIQEAISRKTANRQKVYLATDIAEVSITLLDVVFIIDLVLVKRPQIIKGMPATIAYPPLMMQWGSKSNIAQRRGRVGRVQQGFYFCLAWPELISRLPDYSPPPIEHSRIDELALHALQLCSNPAAIFTICRGQPLMESVATSMNALTHLGCIMPKDHPLASAESISEMYDNTEWSNLILDEARQSFDTAVSIQEYRTTFIGRLLQLMPVSSQQGMLVFFGFLTGLESLMILASAASNSLSPFSVMPDRPRRRGRRGQQAPRENVAHLMEATERVMKGYAKDARSDVVCVMGAALDFMIKRGEMSEAQLRTWCLNNHLSHEKLVAIVDLMQHIKFELEAFLPFRDVQDPRELQQQLAKLSPVVIVLCNAAFAAQALEVIADGSMKTVSREGAVGLFSELRAVPDLHAPSCLRWEPGDIIVPISMSLHYSRLLVGSATVTGNHRQFWLSVLLFTHSLRYANFSDERGPYSMFCVSYCDRTKVIEVDWKTSRRILEFRRKCSVIGKSLRLRYRHRDEPEGDFDNRLQRDYQLDAIEVSQRNVITDLASLFTQEALAQSDLAEVALEDMSDIDLVSILSFALP